ncbi:MAG: ABC transporter, partial [Actinomycetota bacterium]|nr:ABC transporter [Actinomycetota bacterium]
LVVEHDMNFVMEVCDDVIVLDFGELIASGPPDQIRNDPAVIAAYLGDETDSDEESTVAHDAAPVGGGGQ